MSYIAHYGTPRHSGRYPWGSGENPYQHNSEQLRKIKELRDKGLGEGEIAEAMGYKSSTELKAREQAMKGQNKRSDYQYAMALKNKGWSTTAIAKKMGKNESSIRSLLTSDRKFVADDMDRIMSEMTKAVKEHKYVDIGEGTEHYLDTVKDRLDKAAILIQDYGYQVLEVPVKQQSADKQYTTVKVLTKKGVTKKEVYQNLDKIANFADVKPNEGSDKLSIQGLQKPKSIDSKRIKINYADTGTGESKDGIIEIRRGVADLDLGADHYAQVRIAVDDTHYLKGMAIYSDSIPDGYDIVFNTNKKSNTPMCGPKDDTVLKPLEKNKDGSINWDNPFGSSIKMEGGQYTYTDKDGNEHLSSINKLRSEGEWSEWSNNHTLASQMLAKQPVALAKQQLKLTQDMQKAEFDEIMSIEQPTVRRRLLIEYADECDKLAVNLKAAGMPRQATKVILPIPSLKDDEVYAPTLKNGEKVVLIRYPHAGRFEAPELTVNNSNKEGKEVLGGLTLDAIGINKSVADRLSGADFDGDTVLIIPNPTGAIKTMKPLKDLEGFDTKKAYPYEPGMKVLTKKNTNMEMGKISNLITDMTIQDAPPDEMARAVKHSMVIIDAAKHKLNYTKSYRDNNIQELKAKYQSSPYKSGYGASTLLSRNKSPVTIDKRTGSYKIDPDTGEKIWNTSTSMRLDKKTGQYVTRTESVPLLSITKDAHSLSTGTDIEELYAEHSNAMKALANQARKASLGVKTTYSKDASLKYAKEVESLNSKYKQSLMNAPRERQAQRISNVNSYEKYKAGDLWGKENAKERSKIAAQTLAAARAKVGAHRVEIDITPKEWEAINAGALHDTTIYNILLKSDDKKIKEMAMPKTNGGMTIAKINLAKSLASRGYTLEQIATQLGFSTSTISKVIS